jgi:hypothetical protein
MHLILFFLQQTLSRRLDKAKEVHGVSVHMLMIDRLVSFCFFLSMPLYLQLAMVEDYLGKLAILSSQE